MARNIILAQAQVYTIIISVLVFLNIRYLWVMHDSNKLERRNNKNKSRRYRWVIKIRKWLLFNLNHILPKNFVWSSHDSKFKFLSCSNEFLWGNDWNQSSRYRWDIQLLFWSFLHPTLFEQFKIWISKYNNFKQKFQIVNEFK